MCDQLINYLRIRNEVSSLNIINGYSVGQVSKLFGVTTRTVQNWDRKGLLTAKRSSSGQRYFSFASVDQYLCDHPLYTLPKPLQSGLVLVLAENLLYQNKISQALSSFANIDVMKPSQVGAVFSFSGGGHSEVFANDLKVTQSMSIWDLYGHGWSHKVKLLKSWLDNPNDEFLVGNWDNIRLVLDHYDHVLLPSKYNLVFSTIAELALDFKHQKNLSVWDWGTDSMSVREIQAGIAGAQVRL